VERTKFHKDKIGFLWDVLLEAMLEVSRSSSLRSRESRGRGEIEG
jgi:hypothetical protein